MVPGIRNICCVEKYIGGNPNNNSQYIGFTQCCSSLGLKTLCEEGENTPLLLPTFSEIQPRSIFIRRVDSPRLRRAIDFLWEEICPKEWNLSRKAQSPHLQQLKRSIPLCEWMWYLEECQADSRGMWSHRAAVELAALGEAYPAFCQAALSRAQRQAQGLGGFRSGFDTSRGMLKTT